MNLHELACDFQCIVLRPDVYDRIAADNFLGLSERPIGERLLMQFYRAVTSLVRKTNDLEDAYRALSVVLAARESFDAGRRVELQTGMVAARRSA